MPIDFAWRSSEHRLLSITYPLAPSLLELDESVERLAAYARAAEGPFICLLDVRQLQQAPDGSLIAMSRWVTHPGPNHPRIRMMLIVVENGFLLALARIVREIRAGETEIFTTMAAAENFLEHNTMRLLDGQQSGYDAG